MGEGRMSQARFWPRDLVWTGWPDTRLARALRSAGPLLFGLRLWASVCLALYVAFWLQLDNAYWAGTTAAIVCQPQLGASLRKASFRMIGTLIGAVAIVVLTACFPQSRMGFLLSLALWGAACGFVATILRNFAAYAAALAGYTAVIIASDVLGATGGPNGQVFMLAVFRASEICIGIVCAGIVLAGTDFGSARYRLAGQFAALSTEIAGRFAGTFLLAGSDQPGTTPIRRDLVRRVIALDPIIDQAIGEASELRYRSRVLQTAVGGLIAALSGWRMVALHLARLPNDEGRQEAEMILRELPEELRAAPIDGDASNWTADPLRMRRLCLSAVRALAALPASTPSLRLLADNTAEALLGLARALNGLTLLTDPARVVLGPRTARIFVPDWLPAFINGGRAFITISAVALFWIVTVWPSGAMAMTFAAITVILFSPRADQAYPTVLAFLLGTSLTAVLAAIVKFALLPGIETFTGFSLVIGLVLVPAGSLIAQPWQTPMFVAMAANFIPLLAPSNMMTYDIQEFYNSAMAIVAGVGAAALALRLLPPLSPATVTSRLLTLSLRDLRRLAKRTDPGPIGAWERRVYSRLFALPEQAQPLQRTWLAAALSLGSEIIRLRKIAQRFTVSVELDTVLDALVRGQSAVAIERLAQLDRALATVLSATPGIPVRLRARASILAISELLTQYSAYFDAGAPNEVR
jgi:uncharacterized membrane protein YccC